MERSRLKKRFSHLFRASLGSSCKVSSRKVSEAVHEPIFVSRRQDFQKLDRSLSLPSFSEDHSSFQVAPPRLSLDCGRCRPTRADGKKKQRQKREKRVPETGGNGEGGICPPASPIYPSNYCLKKVKEEMERLEIRISSVQNKKTLRRKSKKKLLSNSYGFTSSSSGDQSDENGIFFSSDEGKKGGLEERELETETLFSSKSFSSDSSEFYYHPTLHKKKKSSRKTKPRRGGGDLSNRSFTIRHDRDDGFRPAVAVSPAPAALKEEEKVKRNAGFAVVKQTSDPYGDFRNSMVEMIVEKQIFGAKDLEHLLRCYLSLNSPRHHWIILEVFSEIWETFFGN